MGNDRAATGRGAGRGRRAAPAAGAIPSDCGCDRLRSLYDRCAAMAGIGIWECDLATEALAWSNGVYDLFGLPRGAPVTRDLTKALYTDESRVEMERLRDRAIAACSGFTLDIRIVTPGGEARWIRITAEVEARDGTAVRLFGLKQDMTREKDLLERLQRLAERDPLTGLANRGLFEQRLARADRPAPGDAVLSGVLLLDIDRFKLVNDTFGHEAGDDCLKRVAGTLAQDMEARGLPFRLGGDEFAVLLYGDWPVVDLDAHLARLLARNRYRLARDGRTLDLSVSIGVALAEAADGAAAGSLVGRADRALYAAKAAGRDTVRHDRPGQADGGPAHRRLCAVA